MTACRGGACGQMLMRGARARHSVVCFDTELSAACYWLNPKWSWDVSRCFNIVFTCLVTQEWIGCVWLLSTEVKKQRNLKRAETLNTELWQHHIHRLPVLYKGPALEQNHVFLTALDAASLHSHKHWLKTNTHLCLTKLKSILSIANKWQCIWLIQTLHSAVFF